MIDMIVTKSESESILILILILVAVQQSIWKMVQSVCDSVFSDSTTGGRYSRKGHI